MKRKKSQKLEIVWNIINSLLAGALVFVGACTTGSISLNSLGVAAAASLAVALTKFYEYWKKEEGEYCTKLFSFIR